MEHLLRLTPSNRTLSAAVTVLRAHVELRDGDKDASVAEETVWLDLNGDLEGFNIVKRFEDGSFLVESQKVDPDSGLLGFKPIETR